ncbi:MAG: DUF928 domain-containing protein [Cyanobacteria bacterium P01_H01_bin.15]
MYRLFLLRSCVWLSILGMGVPILPQYSKAVEISEGNHSVERKKADSTDTQTSQQDDPPPKVNDVGGSRSPGTNLEGCTNQPFTGSSPPPLILLSSYEAISVSARPKFVWYFRDAQPYPLTFRLLAFDSETGQAELLHESPAGQLQTRPGIGYLSLPSAVPDLQVGEEYLWQLEVLCQPGRPLKNLFVEGLIKIAPPRASLQIEKIIDPYDLAQRYQRSQLWQDSLAIAVTLPTEEIETQQLKQGLFQNFGLNPSWSKQIAQSPVFYLPDN